MSSDIDDGCDKEQFFRDLDIAAARRSAPVLPVRGQCYFCEEPLAVGRFCDKDCMDDYDKQKSAEIRRGVQQ